MKALMRWFSELFSKKGSLEKVLLRPEDENIILKLRIAGLENNIVQLSEIIQKTGETIVILQKNINQISKISSTSLELAKQHEEIFQKIIEDKLLVFGLTKISRVVDPDDSEPQPD